MGRHKKPKDAPKLRVTSMRFSDGERELIVLRAAMNREALKKVRLFGSNKVKLGSLGMAAVRMVIDHPNLIPMLKRYVGAGEVLNKRGSK